MNWQQLIDQFQPLEKHEVPDFAKTRELEQALQLYNKSLEHISRDSADIALISLRRLASDYPLFGMASLLAGCLLAYDDEFEESLALTTQSIEQGQLEPGWLEEAKRCREALEKELHMASEPDNAEGKKPRKGKSAIDTTAVLEKIKRKQKVKMASERERQKVLRQGDQAEEETFVEHPRQLSDYIRLAVPLAAGVVLLVLLIFAGTRLVSFASADRDTDADQLEWLLSRLESMAPGDEAIDDLLDEFGHLFDQPGTDVPGGDIRETSLPETEATTGETEETTVTESTDPDETDERETTTQPAETTTDDDPQPTPEPTADPDALLLDQAKDALQQARALQSDDVMAAADHLFIAQTILETVPEDTRSDNFEQSAVEVLSEVDALMNELARSAANAYRVAGRALFDQGEFEAALVPYLKAFELDPGNYGGGTAYYTGRSYQELGLYEAARHYYDYVVENFSGRDIAGYSANRLREMGY